MSLRRQFGFVVRLMLLRSFAYSFAILLASCGGSVPSATKNEQSNSSPAQAATSSQTVVINSQDGVRILGTFLSPPKSIAPALLLLHQWQNDRHSYDQFAKR